MPNHLSQQYWSYAETLDYQMNNPHLLSILHPKSPTPTKTTSKKKKIIKKTNLIGWRKLEVARHHLAPIDINSHVAFPKRAFGADMWHGHAMPLAVGHGPIRNADAVKLLFHRHGDYKHSRGGEEGLETVAVFRAYAKKMNKTK